MGVEVISSIDMLPAWSLFLSMSFTLNISMMVVREMMIHALIKRYGSLHCLKKKEPFTTAPWRAKRA